MRWPCIGLAMLVALVTLLCAGGARTGAMLQHTRDQWLTDLHGADFDIRFPARARGLAPTFASDPDVLEVNERLVAPGRMRLREDDRWTPAVFQVLHTSEAPATVNRIHLLAGRMPRAGEPALVVDRSLVDSHGVNLGDSITLRVDDEQKTAPIVGVAVSCEHLLTPVNPQYALPLRGSLAVIAVSDAVAEDKEITDRANSLVVRVKPGANVQAVAARCLTSPELSGGSVTYRTEQGSYAFSDMIIKTFNIYLPTLAFVLVLVAIAMLALTLLRMVERQRHQLGTERVLGYRAKDIALSFLPLSLIPIAVGWLAGVAVHGLLAKRFFHAYSESVGYAPLRDPGIGWPPFALAGAYVVIALIACCLPAWCTAKIAPARLLRSGVKAGSARGRSGTWLATLRSVFRFPLSIAMGIAHIFRHRWISITTIVVLGATLAVDLAFLIVHVTHREEVSAAVDRMGLDATVQFDGPVALEDILRDSKNPAFVLEPQITKPALITTSTGSRFRRTVGANPGAWLNKLKIARGKRFASAHDRSILIDHWIADQQGLDVGDTIDIAAGKDTPDVVTCEVAGVMDGVSLGFAVVPLEVMREIFFLPELMTDTQVSSALGDQELRDTLWALPSVETVHVLSQARMEVARNFEGSGIVLLAGLFLAIAVAATYLAILAAMDAKDRSRDLSVLQAIGWRKRSVLSLCLTEVLVRGLLALAIALPTAPLIARWLLSRIEEANHYRMDLYSPAWLVAAVVALALALIPFGALPAFRTATRVRPAEALRQLVD